MMFEASFPKLASLNFKIDFELVAKPRGAAGDPTLNFKPGLMAAFDTELTIGMSAHQSRFGAERIPVEPSANSARNHDKIAAVRLRRAEAVGEVMQILGDDLDVFLWNCYRRPRSEFVGPPDCGVAQAGRARAKDVAGVRGRRYHHTLARC
jgi:hypothetical protein